VSWFKWVKNQKLVFNYITIINMIIFMLLLKIFLFMFWIHTMFSMDKDAKNKNTAWVIYNIFIYMLILIVLIKTKWM